MPYRLNAAGQIECDTAEEAIALVGTSSPNKATGKKSGKKGTKSGVGEAIAKSWAEARKLAHAEGITVKEARSKLKGASKSTADPDLVPIHSPRKKRTPRKKAT